MLQSEAKRGGAQVKPVNFSPKKESVIDANVIDMMGTILQSFQSNCKSDVAQAANTFFNANSTIDASSSAISSRHKLQNTFCGSDGLIEMMEYLSEFELTGFETKVSPCATGDVFVEITYTPKCKATQKSGSVTTDMHKWIISHGKVLRCKIMWGNADQFTTISTPSLSTNTSTVAIGKSYSGGSDDWPLVVVSSYTQFSNLAHGPRGTEAAQSAWTYRLNPNNGQLTLLAVNNDSMNPAFSRAHPTKNVVYACTESIETNGDIVSWSMDPISGQLTKMGAADAQGTSTCFISLDKTGKNAIVVNYWNATIVVLAVNPDTGVVGKPRCIYDPNEGREMSVSSTKHVNHSKNDKSAQAERQLDPHSHSAILDPFLDKIVFVPDLGMDLIRQLLFDDAEGKITPIAHIPSGAKGKTALGPRYIEFHPTLPFAYVINELSSEVAVFKFDLEIAKRVVATGVNESVLELVQMISTLPVGFPQSMNTCGRLAVHSSGKFVLVSNRGHDSIAVLNIDLKGDTTGHLNVASIQHTRGCTPRHFQFDSSGQWLIVANQDSDCIATFGFNLRTGAITSTGNDYRVPSPNFICFVDPK